MMCTPAAGVTAESESEGGAVEVEISLIDTILIPVASTLVHGPTKFSLR